MEVAEDLWPFGEAQKALIRPTRVDAVLCELLRFDPIEDRRLVQPHERVSIVPVAAGRVTLVDECDVCIGSRQQLIRKAEPHGSGADHEVVDFQWLLLATGRARRRASQRALRARARSHFRRRC